MLKFFICLVIVLNVIPVNAAIIGTSRYNNNGFQSNLNMNKPKTIITGHRNYNQPYYNYREDCPHCYHHNPYYGYNRIPAGSLNALEKYALNRNYRRENDLQRLERLESLAFGSIQSGDINSRYRNVENAILSRPQQNYRRSVIGNIANYFAGQATGYTPSITGDFANLGGFSNFPDPNYNNQRFEQYNNGIFGSGWGIQNQSFGNGTRVQILD